MMKARKKMPGMAKEPGGRYGQQRNVRAAMKVRERRIERARSKVALSV